MSERLDPSIGVKNRFIEDFSDLIILNLLRETPVMGAEGFIGLIYERFNAIISIERLKSTLFSLEMKRRIKARGKADREYYEITDKGEALNKKLLEAYHTTQKDVSDFLEQQW